MDPSEFEDLVYEYLDGRASPESLKDLSAALERDPALARLFVDIAGADVLLSERYGSSLSADYARAEEGRRSSARLRAVERVRRTSRRIKPVHQRPRSRMWGLWAAAAAAVLVAVVIWHVGGDDEVARPRVARDEPGLDVPQTVDGPSMDVPEDDDAAPEPRREPTAPITVVEVDTAPEVEVPAPAPEFVAVDDAVETPDAPETEHPVARLGELAGLVKCRRGGGAKWFKASAGLPLLSGDEIDTRSAMAQVVFAGGSRVSLNKSTWVKVGADRIEIVRSGEVYCEVAQAAKGKFAVVTEHVRITDLGTRFGVDVSVRGTLVVVAEGSVEAKNGHGAVVIGEDQQSRTASAKVAPATPKPVDAAKAVAWARSAFDPWKTVLSESFEAAPVGATPAGWEYRDLRGKGTANQWKVAQEGREKFLRWGGKGEGYMVLPGGEEYTDVEISFRYRAPKGGGGFALRGDCWHTGYEFQLGTKKVELVRSDGAGKDTTLMPMMPVDLAPDAWHRVVARIIGDEMWMSIDGKEMVSRFKDTKYAKGPLTFDAIRSQADFDDVVVRVLKLP